MNENHCLLINAPARRTEALFQESLAAFRKKSDRIFAGLLPAQWLLGITFAVMFSPATWTGGQSQTHIHLYAAVILGALIISLPLVMALRWPGEAATRHSVAAGQMLISALLIHLSGGRIETHFHVFGVLALLAFYRDRKVLMTATAFVILDHGLRGIFWPQSVYGIDVVQPWRFFEHVGWVAFEVVFLCVAIGENLKEMRKSADIQSKLELTNSQIEIEVEEQTRQLKSSEEKFHQFAENIKQVLWMTDAKQETILYVSPAYETVWGRSCESLYQNPYSYIEAIHPEDRERMHKIFTQEITVGYDERYRVIHPDGGVRMIWDRSFPVRDASGQIYRVVGIAEDITETKKAELELRASEERFRQLAENIQQVFWITDPATRQMIYISPAYEKVWGQTCESLYRNPRAFIDAIHPEERERMLGIIQAKAEKNGFTEEYRIIRPDGSLRWIKDRAFPVRDASGKVYRVVGIAEDVTDTKKLQMAVAQTEKLSAVGQLAAGVAHEINNPLGVILGFSQSLISRLENPSPLSMPLQSIEREAKRCKDLVQDLLTFSRNSVAGREPLDLNQVLEGAITLVDARAKMGRVEIQKDLAPGLPKILGNQNQIQQIVVNLSNNAFDAMTEGGVLKLATQLVKENRAEAILLTVTDNGTGIPAETLKRIFEPFFTTKAVGKGTGLGLSLVHEIVAKHSGSVEAISRPGCTEFHIKFPVMKEEPRR